MSNDKDHIERLEARIAELEQELTEYKDGSRIEALAGDEARARCNELSSDRRDCHIMIGRIAHKMRDPILKQAVALVQRQDPDAFNPLREDAS